MWDFFLVGLAISRKNADFRRRFEHWSYVIFYKSELVPLGDFEVSVKIFMWWGYFSSIISEKLFLIIGYIFLLNSNSWVLSLIFHIHVVDCRKIIFLNMSGLNFIGSNIILYILFIMRGASGLLLVFRRLLIGAWILSFDNFI